jgi:hypothetical protein
MPGNQKENQISLDFCIIAKTSEKIEAFSLVFSITPNKSDKK